MQIHQGQWYFCDKGRHLCSWKSAIYTTWKTSAERLVIKYALTWEIMPGVVLLVSKRYAFIPGFNDFCLESCRCSGCEGTQSNHVGVLVARVHNLQNNMSKCSERDRIHLIFLDSQQLSLSWDSDFSSMFSPPPGNLPLLVSPLCVIIFLYFYCCLKWLTSFVGWFVDASAW